MWRILVVEDSADARKLIERALAADNQLTMATTLADAEACLRRDGVVDLILLDVSLPDGDGYELCARLQADARTRDIPVIFLTGRTATADKVMAFSLGAEDFVSKPFDAVELRARVDARLQRAQERARRAEVVRKGALCFHLSRHRVTCMDGEAERELDLTTHEFRLLYYLASRDDRVVTRNQLLTHVWDGADVVGRTVDTHVSNVRRKLGRFGPAIQTVRGVGYRFVVDAVV